MTKLTLLCLPYSGASAMVYSRWRRKVPQWLDVQPVELPGRGARYAEALHTDMRTLAMQLAREQKARLTAPYALFGHSLGALLACEMAHAFRTLGCPEPVALFASGTAALETTWIEQIEDVDMDDLNPESLWKFRIRNFGPLLVAMDSHGGSLYSVVKDEAQARRAQVLASLGVKA